MNYSRCLATVPFSRWSESESFSVGCKLRILCRPQQCPCLDQFNGNAYFSGSRTDVRSKWCWSQYSLWNNLCPHTRHFLSHPTILKNSEPSWTSSRMLTWRLRWNFMRIWRLWISWWSNGDLIQRSWVRFPPRSETFLRHWEKEVPDPVEQWRFLIHHTYRSVRPHLISAIYIYIHAVRKVFTLIFMIYRSVLADTLIVSRPTCWSITTVLFFLMCRWHVGQCIAGIRFVRTPNNYHHSMHFFLPFHWPRAHHLTCK